MPYLVGSNPLKLLANLYPKFGARMKLENDDKAGQGRGAFNPETQVQIPMGAVPYLYIDKKIVGWCLKC